MITSDSSGAYIHVKKTLNAKNQEAFKIFAKYAADIMAYFATVQGSAPAESQGAFWTNHTFKAVEGFFVYPFSTPMSGDLKFRNVGLTIKNKTWYAYFLEFAHDKRFASFPKLLEVFLPKIEADINVLYGQRGY